MRNNKISAGNSMVIFLAASFVFGSFAASASDQVGTVTQLDGDVKLFTHPSKTLQKDAGTHVLYEGEYYLVESAKPGLKLEQGNIIRTAPSGKARVIYPNGDQMYIGPASALRVFWDKDSKDGKTQMELAYGKLRGVVEKGGPRSKLQIRTKTATMGVRGTDFFIADGGQDGGTEVSIIRGSVEVKPDAPKAKPVEIKQGFSVTVPPVAQTPQVTTQSTEAAKVVPTVELRKTTQQELQGIQKSSTLEAKREEAPAEIKKLEEKAVQTTLKDIKTHDPKLFKEIKKDGAMQTIAEINTKAVTVLVADAPKAPEKRKPFKSEVEDLEAGAYEKYFKPQE